MKSGPAVLLGQWQERTLNLVDAVEGLVDLSRFRWTAERLVRRDLLNALHCGPGVALYFGHALSGGWVGYGGVAAETLITMCGEPLGAVVSIACETARRPEGRSSFCEELVLGGYCAAALGASARTLHEHNRILARGLCSALGRAQSLGDALRLAEVPDDFFSHYRIFGDPGAPPDRSRARRRCSKAGIRARSGLPAQEFLIAMEHCPDILRRVHSIFMADGFLNL
ncbi:MAG: C25 family cysteine peptidase [Terriglobales bacterium]